MGWKEEWEWLDEGMVPAEAGTGKMLGRVCKGVALGSG